MPGVPIWIDCDPGHDDAFALLLAAYSPEVRILGVSIVHGNDEVEHCALNALRFLWTCGVKGIPVYKGTSAPIVREPKYCPEIHGVPGEDGVSGMCGFHFPDELIFSSNEYKIQNGHGVLKMAETIRSHDGKVTVVATGAQTNVALALRLFPEIKDNIQQIIFMGGAIGLGNTGVAAEFNIEIDPEAAHIVLHSGIPLVMIPLEVTHLVLLTDEILHRIRQITVFGSTETKTTAKNSSEIGSHEPQHPNVEYNEISARIQDVQSVKSDVPATAAPTVLEASSPFADCCYQLLTFFKSTYFSVFSFQSPPLHDPCTIYYLINPTAFATIDLFVDVELNSGKCTGRTLCDIHDLHKKTPNVKLCVKLDVDAFWKRFLHCVHLADQNSPLNANALMSKAKK